MKEIQLPEEKIQQLAEKYAMEGAEKAIREYYTGYDSPYVKALTARIREIAPSPLFDLPDITAVINKALSDRIMDLCNQFMANTYAKLFNRMLTPSENNLVTTESLFQKFGDYIKDREDDEFDEEGLEFKAKKSQYLYSDNYRSLEFWYNGELEFRLSVWDDGGKNEKGEVLYTLASLPGHGQYSKHDNRSRFAKITLEDGKTAEVPIIDDVLSNDFLAYLAHILICRTKIEVELYPQYHNYQ